MEAERRSEKAKGTAAHHHRRMAGAYHRGAESKGLADPPRGGILDGMKVLLLAAALFCVQDAADLQLSLKKEKTLRTRLAVEEDTASVAVGTTEKLEDRGGWELGLESKGSPGAGLSTIHVTILRITRVSGSRSVDTSNPGPRDPPEAAFLKALIGEAVDVDVAADGAIKEVRGMADLEAHFAAKLGVKPGPEGPRKGLKASIENRLREQLGGVLSVYPGKPAAVGASWSRKQSISLGAAYKAETTWTVAARRESRVSLEGKVLLTPIDESRVESPTIQKLSGTGEAALELDAETGFPLKGRIVHPLKGTSTLKGIPNPRPSDTFDQTSRVTFTLEAWEGK